MIINDNFVEFHDFLVLILKLHVCFEQLLDSFRIQKFLDCNPKVKVKGKKININY